MEVTTGRLRFRIRAHGCCLRGDYVESLLFSTLRLMALSDLLSAVFGQQRVARLKVQAQYLNL